MKVKIDVECSPEEGRTFLGLPDVAPMQQEMMTELQGKLAKAAKAMNPEDMMKPLFPAGAEGLVDMQKTFWSALRGADMSEKTQ